MVGLAKISLKAWSPHAQVVAVRAFLRTNSGNHRVISPGFAPAYFGASPAGNLSFRCGTPCRFLSAALAASSLVESQTSTLTSVVPTLVYRSVDACRLVTVATLPVRMNEITYSSRLAGQTEACCAMQEHLQRRSRPLQPNAV